MFVLKQRHLPWVSMFAAAIGAFVACTLLSTTLGAKQAARLRREHGACMDQLHLLKEDESLFATCNKELERERGVIRSLSHQMRTIQAECTPGSTATADSGTLSPNAAPSGWRPSFWPFGDDENAGNEGEVYSESPSQKKRAQRMRAEATYTDATAIMEAVLAGEAAEQELHTCKQERARVVAAQHTTLTELAACEERLLKQDAWAASLAATNQVLNEHLLEANDELGTMHSSYIAIQEVSTRLESAHATLLQSNESAANTVC